MPHLRSILIGFGVFLLALVVGLPLAAQEARWKGLDAQVEQLQKRGKYAEAQPVAQEALRVAEATYGAQHANTAVALEKLGKVYQAQGKYAEAEPVFKRALDIREKALGPEHSLVAMSLNDLAIQVVEDVCHIRVLGSKGLLPNGQRALEEWFRLCVLTP